MSREHAGAAERFRCSYAEHSDPAFVTRSHQKTG